MRDIDERVLKELEKNSRATNTEIAKKLKVSEGTVRQRIQKLLKDEIIKKFTVERSTLFGFSAVVLVETQPNVQTSVIVDKIKKIEDIKRIYELSGGYDVLVKITTKSADKFNNIIEKIRAIQGIIKTKSLIILKIT
jgi:DNA-binding Lrp family transcriptional regulator